MLSSNRVDSAPTTDKSSLEYQKRKRDVLSCLDCRRRKLKCDRIFPVCGRCERGGNSDSCVYKSVKTTDGIPDGRDGSIGDEERSDKRIRLGNGQQSNVNTTSSSYDPLGQSDISSLTAQERIIKRLESRLADLEQVVARERLGRNSVEDPSPARSRTRDQETYLFKGRGFKTQFYGPSLPTNQLAHVCSSTPESNVPS